MKNQTFIYFFFVALFVTLFFLYNERRRNYEQPQLLGEVLISESKPSQTNVIDVVQIQSDPPKLLKKTEEDFIKIPDTSPLRSPGQSKRGYDAMITQLAKPLKCVKKSFWRGSQVKGQSVDQRLDEALATRDQWPQRIKAAVDRCQNGYPQLTQEEFGLLLSLIKEGDLVLEWGSGKSSCPIATVVGELHSVDDSSTWTSSFLNLGLLPNQQLHWMPSFEAAGTLRPPFEVPVI